MSSNWQWASNPPLSLPLSKHTFFDVNPCLRIEWRRFTICSAPKVRSLAGLQGLLRDWPSRWFERFSDRMSDFEQSQQFKLPQVLCVISVPFFARTPEGTIAVFPKCQRQQLHASAPCKRTLHCQPHPVCTALPIVSRTTSNTCS